MNPYAYFVYGVLLLVLVLTIGAVAELLRDRRDARR